MATEYNRLYNIKIKDESKIPATLPYITGNVCFMAPQKSQLSSVVATSLAIGKDVSLNVLDVCGNSFFDGRVDVSGSLYLNGTAVGGGIPIDVSNNFVWKTGSVAETITGVKTFSVPPLCSANATQNNELIRRIYADSRYVMKDPATSEFVYGTKTFISVPECSTSATSANQLTNYDTLVNYVNANTLLINGAVTQTVTGIKTFGARVICTNVNIGQNNNDLINITYANTRYAQLATANTFTQNNRFTNVGIGTPASTDALDVVGSSEFSNVNTTITLTNPAMTAFTGFTTPVYPTQTTLISNANNTQTLNGWTITMGTLGTTIWSNGNNGLEFYGGTAPGYTYHLWNRSYKSKTYTLQQTITLTAGIHILTFWSYWGYQNYSGGGATGASLTVSVLNSTDTYTYSDPDTRNGSFWRQHTFRFTVNSTGSSYIRWTPSDSAPNDTPFPWAITGLILKRYDAVKLTDSTSSVASYLAGDVNVLRNAYINNIYGSGVLTLTGTPSFLLGSGNKNCLAINSSFGTYSTPTNTNSIMMGQAVGLYGTTYDRMFGYGYNINDSASPPITAGSRCVMIGANIRTGRNKDVLIGNFVKSSGDTTGQNVAVGCDIGVSTTDTLDGVGVGRRTIAIGNEIFSGTYNGFGILPTQPLECVAIGHRAQRTSFDNYNTSVGAYTLQSIIGTNNQTGSGVTTPNLTAKNTVMGWSSASNRTLLNNCSFFGAETTSTVNDVSFSTIIGYGSTVGASYATAIGAGVVNNVANSIRLGRSTDLVRVDGSLNVGVDVGITGNLTVGTDVAITGNLTVAGDFIPTNPLSGYVLTTGDQTIAGNKTFTGDFAIQGSTSNDRFKSNLYFNNFIEVKDGVSFRIQQNSAIEMYATGGEQRGKWGESLMDLSGASFQKNYMKLQVAQNGSINGGLTITKPFNQIQPVQVSSTNFTITLPTISTFHELGHEILFRKTNTGGTATVSFIGQNSQKIYDLTNTAYTTAVGLMTSSTYIVRLVSLRDDATGGGVFAWYQTQ